MDSHQNPHRLESRVVIPWTIARIVLTVVFGVVIVIALVFPAAAQAYAQASIPALGDGAVSNIPIPEDEPIAPSDSLDIRSLPLLDEQSATLWEDPNNADTVGRTVFADQWDALVEAANSPISSLDIMPFTTVDNSTLDHVREIVAQRLDELGSEGDQKALNLMSLLENYGDIRATSATATCSSSPPPWPTSCRNITIPATPGSTPCISSRCSFVITTTKFGSISTKRSLHAPPTLQRRWNG